MVYPSGTNKKRSEGQPWTTDLKTEVSLVNCVGKFTNKTLKRAERQTWLEGPGIALIYSAFLVCCIQRVHSHSLPLVKSHPLHKV